MGVTWIVSHPLAAGGTGAGRMLNVLVKDGAALYVASPDWLATMLTVPVAVNVIVVTFCQLTGLSAVFVKLTDRPLDAVAANPTVSVTRNEAPSAGVKTVIV